LVFDGGPGNGEKKVTMSVKRWLLWVCLVLIFVSQWLLFSANKQKDAAQTDARDAHEKVKLLQSQLDDLKASSVVELGLDNARLRQENQRLTQQLALANTNLLQLTTAGQLTAQQLETARLALKLQQNHLQEMADQAAQPMAPPPPPALSPEAAQQLCLQNLQQIDTAKQAWALDNSKDATDVPTAQDLEPYLKGNAMPVCPSGGAYTIGAMNQAPACSIAGHSLPAKGAKSLRWQSN
jgi:hypothetical protein